MNLTDRLARHLSVAPEAIHNLRTTATHALAIVDYGIAGAKQTAVALAALPGETAIAPSPPAPPVTLFTAPTLDNLNATDAALAMIKKHSLDPALFKRDDRVTVSDVNYILKRRREKQ